MLQIRIEKLGKAQSTETKRPSLSFRICEKEHCNFEEKAMATPEEWFDGAEE